jgi:hypothetical protein
MQRWITVRGAASHTTAQPESAWLDLGRFRDCGLFYEVSDTSGSPLLDFQSAPTRDSTLMRSVHTGAVGTPTIGVSTLSLLGLGGASTNPVSRYLRWSVTSSSAWSITFRVWASPNLASAHDADVPLRNHEFQAQKWTTLFGGAGKSVAAPMNAIVDLELYRDVVMFVEVADVSASTTLFYDTAPTCDEKFFSGMTSLTATVGVTATPIRYDTATIPLARYLRWRWQASAAWHATFRIWASAKPCGPKPSQKLIRRSLGAD